jgi:Protein of unknown function (DUF3467)
MPELWKKHRELINGSAIVKETAPKKVLPRNVRGGKRMAEAPKQQQAQGAQIKADEKELLGQYSNLVVVHHNAEEFTLNFVYMFPTVAQGKLVASLILNPRHAKRLLRALEENVSRYEAQFGKLPDAPAPDAEPKVGFVQ